MPSALFPILSVLSFVLVVLLQFAEPTVDMMRAQKDDELKRYRAAAEERAAAVPGSENK